MALRKLIQERLDQSDLFDLHVILFSLLVRLALVQLRTIPRMNFPKFAVIYAGAMVVFLSLIPPDPGYLFLAWLGSFLATIGVYRL